MNEDLEYNAGSSVLDTDTQRKDPDVANVSILKQLLKEVSEMISSYKTIDTLSLDDKHFTIEQQLELNKRYVNLLTTLELLIKEKVKELSNGR